MFIKNVKVKVINLRFLIVNFLLCFVFIGDKYDNFIISILICF